MTNSKQTRRKFKPTGGGESSPRQPQVRELLKKSEWEALQGSDEGWWCMPRACRGSRAMLFHAKPEKLAELGRQGGQKNRRWPLDVGSLPHRSLKSINKSPGCWKETINRVRQGPFDLRAANVSVSGRHSLEGARQRKGGRASRPFGSSHDRKERKRILNCFDFKSAEDSKHEEQ